MMESFQILYRFLRILDLLLLVSVLSKTGVNWVWFVNRIDGVDRVDGAIKNNVGQIIRKNGIRNDI